MGMFSRDEMEMVRDRHVQELEDKLRRAGVLLKKMDLIIRDATEAAGNEPFWDAYLPLLDEVDELSRT